MQFNKEYDYIVGDVVDLKLIGTYEGNDKEIPFYWFDIVSKMTQKNMGKISIRIGSNYHSYYNGNIGYEVDEEYRGHGYSYYACLMVLDIARYHGMERINITCDADNIPSWKTIERLGGRLLEEVVPPKDYVFYYEGIPAQKIYLLELGHKKLGQDNAAQGSSESENVSQSNAGQESSPQGNTGQESTAQENPEQEHKRRLRYKGTHPRHFEEKYKELNPEKYKEDVKKIIDQGKTPAGMHIPIMVDEILKVLDIKPGETGYDATLGYGGHTVRMLEKLNGKGHLYATDVDPVESEKTKKRLADMGYKEDIFTVRHMNFADVDKVASGIKFDFVLADLGVSSMQIDNPERGFTFKQDGPLDLRLDSSSGITAAQRLKELKQDEIAAMLYENSDEPHAERIAKEINRIRKSGGRIETTWQLRAAVERALSFLPFKDREQEIKKSCQRTFQALRIDVNSEFEVLYAFLEKLPSVLNSGGRVAILTFHSGEDRLVKKSFKACLKEGIYSAANDDVIRPTGEECYKNPRAHSAKLRWAVRA